MVDRIARVSEEVKKEISDIIKNELKDPRLPEMLSIMKADVARDFSHAKIYYSVLCDEADKKDVAKALQSASGYVRRELGNRIKLRRVPELHFQEDDSIGHGIRLNRLIDETRKRDAQIEKESGSDDE